MVKSKKTIMIIGLGGMGSGWAREILKHKDDYELRGIIDVDTELLENVPKMNLGLDEDQVYTSIEEACKFGEKPDVVVIATPINTHSGIVHESMALGINTICEKNMASDLQQGKQMVQLAIDHPELCTAVGTQYRYGGQVWTAKRFFEQETNPIGKFGMILWEDYGYRGDKRWGWRRFLQEVYLEDMSVHWMDTLRYITGMNIVQVKADTFMPRYSSWYGSSTVFANLALAKPENYSNRHEWVWCHFAGDWQKNGPTSHRQEFYGGTGCAKITDLGIEITTYKNLADTSKDFDQDAYLGIDAGPRENMPNCKWDGDGMILEMMKIGIESGGKIQPGTNFREAFKSFAVSMACKESTFTGQTIWVPNYWKNMGISDEEYRWNSNL